MARTFVAWDLAGNQIGQIERAYERRLVLPHNGMSAGSCRLHLRDPLGREIMARKGKVLIGVYRGSTLEFVGDCTMPVLETRSREGKPPGISCNFGGPMWRLAKRRTGKTDFSVTPPNTALLIAPQDVGTTISQLIQVANSESDTGIRTGTITPTVNAGYGPVGYKQLAEAISELADIKVFPLETPTWSISDNFAGTGALIGTSFDTGAGTWAGAGNPLDLTLDGTAYRQGTAAIFDETLDRGHWAIAHTTAFTNVIVQVDVKFLEGPIEARLGVFARRSGTFLGGDECWLNATLDPTETSQLTVRKCVNGTHTTINQATLPALATEFYPVRLQVQDDGQYFVWASNIGALSETMLIKGFDADLATGGALATGTTGIYDAYIDNGVTSNRIYDNFRVGVPSASPTMLGLEYELVPSVPTLDTNQSGVVGDGIKIATLNVAPRIGSDTTTVFEWGDGNSSMEHFRWVVDRGQQMNRGYSLPPDFSPGAGGWDVKQSSDLTSMAHPLDGGYGWYEDVVGDSDFSDPGLRQAYVDEEVRIRGIPREVITFEPSANSPTFGTDYAVGDTVIARAQDDGVELFNAQLRVDSVEITIDDNGRETVTPNLVPGDD